MVIDALNGGTIVEFQSEEVPVANILQSGSYQFLNDLSFIADPAGNEFLIFDQTASAVNEITVGNAATGGKPFLKATGGDTHISLQLIPKGTGGVAFPDGTNSAVAIAQNGNPDNGIYFDSTSGGRVLISTNGTLAGYFESGQLFSLGSLHAVSGITSSDTILNVSGSAGTPSYNFAADTGTDTGFYRSAENEIGISTNGTARGKWSNSGFTIGASGSPIASSLTATTTWDPASLANGASEKKSAVTLTGVAVGDVVTAALSTITSSDWAIQACATATNTVEVKITNNTGGVVDLASGTLRINSLKF